MKTVTIIPIKKPDPYVMEVVLLEESDPKAVTRLPFYADGYPGIMFHQTRNGVYQYPLNKKLSEFFLYGQTILPIELTVTGKYKFLVFQLFPSAVKTLLQINPRELNDNCYDLNTVKIVDPSRTVKQLRTTSKVSEQVDIISSFLNSLIPKEKSETDAGIYHAVNLILDSKGKITIKNLRERLHISERTLERQFLSQVGVSPKQFAKIIQFQLTLNKLTSENYQRLTDIAFDHGFADQSHFIRSFKKFTGYTPMEMRSRMWVLGSGF